MVPPPGSYPGVSRWLVLLPALPAALSEWRRTGDLLDAQPALVAALARPSHLLAARSVFIVVSALGSVWLYLAARALGRPRWEATVAAAGLGLSWEFAYHARWLAPDCIVAQFSALTLYFLARHLRDKGGRWLEAAAMGAGLAAGAKYPGLVLLSSLLLANALARPRFDLRFKLRRAALLVGIAFAAYLVTSPATVFQPFKFIEGYRFVTAMYEHANANYGVAKGFDHLRVVAAYFGFAYFSPYKPVAVALFAGVFIGGYAWLRDERSTAAVLLVFPVTFLVLYCFRYRTAVVRNYLLLAPFLALFAARGVAEVAGRLKPLWARRAGAVALAGAGLAQGAFLIRAGESIRHFDLEREAVEAVDYVRSHPNTTFHLSAGVRSLAERAHVALPPNARRDGQELVFFVQAEGPSSFDIRTNDPFLMRAVFGPREVNLNFYASWRGRDHVVVMTNAKARASKVILPE